MAKIGAEWWIYFDHYAEPRHYGAMRTADWKTFEDVTSQVNFPADQARHGGEDPRRTGAEPSGSAAVPLTMV